MNLSSSKNHEEHSGICTIVAEVVDLGNRMHLPSYFLTVSVITITINAVFAFAAVFGNVLVLVSIWRTPSLHCPSNVLICSLAVSDFLVGFMTQPFFVTRNIAVVLGNLELFCRMHLATMITGYVFATASLVTLTSMSVERLLALHLHMRYNSLITVRKTAITIVGYWLLVIILSLLFGFLLRSRASFIIIPTISIPCILTCWWCYWKIFRIIRRHRRQIRHNQIQMVQVGSYFPDPYPDLRRYRRRTNSLLYIIAVIALCYIPFVLLVLVTLPSDEEDMKISAATQMFMTVIFLNSSLNPPIYFWRVAELRLAARNTLRDLADYLQNCFQSVKTFRCRCLC